MEGRASPGGSVEGGAAPDGIGEGGGRSAHGALQKI